VKNKGSLGQCREVVRAVLTYLIKNPDAKDTTEGVRRWWLPEDYRKHRQEELEEILDYLVSKTWLTTRTTTHQKKIYGLNKECLEQIKDCLKNEDRQER